MFKYTDRSVNKHQLLKPTTEVTIYRKGQTNEIIKQPVEKTNNMFCAKSIKSSLWGYYKILRITGLGTACEPSSCQKLLYLPPAIASVFSIYRILVVSAYFVNF